MKKNKILFTALILFCFCSQVFGLAIRSSLKTDVKDKIYIKLQTSLASDLSVLWKKLGDIKDSFNSRLRDLESYFSEDTKVAFLRNIINKKIEQEKSKNNKNEEELLLSSQKLAKYLLSKKSFENLLEKVDKKFNSILYNSKDDIQILLDFFISEVKEEDIIQEEDSDDEDIIFVQKMDVDDVFGEIKIIFKDLEEERHQYFQTQSKLSGFRGSLGEFLGDYLVDKNGYLVDQFRVLVEDMDDKVRIIDTYDPVNKIAHEIKAGDYFQKSFGPHLQEELEKDLCLLKTRLDLCENIKWHYLRIFPPKSKSDNSISNLKAMIGELEIPQDLYDKVQFFVYTLPIFKTFPGEESFLNLPKDIFNSRQELKLLKTKQSLESRKRKSPGSFPEPKKVKQKEFVFSTFIPNKKLRCSDKEVTQAMLQTKPLTGMSKIIKSIDSDIVSVLKQKKIRVIITNDVNMDSVIKGYWKSGEKKIFIDEEFYNSILIKQGRKIEFKAQGLASLNFLLYKMLYHFQGNKNFKSLEDIERAVEEAQASSDAIEKVGEKIDGSIIFLTNWIKEVEKRNREQKYEYYSAEEMNTFFNLLKSFSNTGDYAEETGFSPKVLSQSPEIMEFFPEVAEDVEENLNDIEQIYQTLRCA